MDSNSIRSGSTTTCAICLRLTHSVETRRCDRCWELERRVNDSPELAELVLKALRTGRSYQELRSEGSN